MKEPLLSHRFSLPGEENRARKSSVWALLALVLSLAHIAATWGHIGIFWGDHGRWLHEVERFAQGEKSYRDYSWAFPPLALWLLGEMARIFGSGVNVIWTVTSIICVLIFLAYCRYVSWLVQLPFVPGVLVGGFLLSTAFANYGSAPLPAGMYTPAATVGFLCLLIAVLLCLYLLRTPRLSYAIGLGCFCGLTLLAKQDFWLPSIYLMAVSGSVVWGARQPTSRVFTLSLIATFLSTVLIGVLILGVQSGWATLAGIPGGSGQASEYWGRAFPSWERITVEVTAVALLVLTVVACLAIANAVSLVELRGLILVLALTAIFGSSLYLWMTYRTGLRVRREGISPFPTVIEESLWASKGSPWRGANFWLKWRLREHLFPALLPALVAIVVAARWQRFHSPPLRNTVIFLAGLCVTARLRRGFENVEWYHFLLEIPCYFLAIQLFVPDSSRRMRTGLIIILIVLVSMGMRCYRQLAVGPLTRSSAFERVDTPKGSIYLRADDPKLYRQLRETLTRLDPSDKRPVFAFGFSGGFNYFLNRPNPTPLTYGFLSSFSPDKVASDLLRHTPRPFLIDNAAFHLKPGQSGSGRFPLPKIDLRRWDLTYGESLYNRLDWHYFAKLIAACKLAATIPTTPVITVYDCNRQSQ